VADESSETARNVVVSLGIDGRTEASVVLRPSLNVRLSMDGAADQAVPDAGETLSNSDAQGLQINSCPANAAMDANGRSGRTKCHAALIGGIGGLSGTA